MKLKIAPKKHDLCRYTLLAKALPILGLLVFMGLGNIAVQAQTPGLIFKSSADLGGIRPLDPNKDGYVSETTFGFSLNDEDESEIPYRKIPAKNEPNSDLATGPSCGFTDFVQNTNKYSAATYFDGTYLYFRFRLANPSPASKGYSILIDTDGLFGSGNDPNYNAANPGFELEVIYVTNFGVRVYDVDGWDGSGTRSPIIEYPEAQYSHKAICQFVDCDAPNVFYDFFIPFSILQAAPFNLTTTTPLRMVANTVQSTRSAVKGPISDIGGVEGTDPAAWEEMIDIQPGTSVSGINAGPIQEKSVPPVVSGPINDGATTVSGTSTEADGTTIEIFKDGVSIGTTTVTGGSWSLTGIAVPLVSGEVITATAIAPDKLLSEISNAVTVSCATAVAPPTGFALSFANPRRVLSVVNTVNAFAQDAEITIYRADNGGIPTIINSGSTVLPALPATGITTAEYCWRCDLNGVGGISCGNGGGAGTFECGLGSYWATYKATPTSCVSTVTTPICQPDAIPTTYTAFSVNTPISVGQTNISGQFTPNNLASGGTGTYRIYVFVGTATAPEIFLGSATISATATVPTSWGVTLASGTSVVAGKRIVVYIQKVAATACFGTPAFSGADITAPNPTAAPVVNGPIATNATSISGTSTEANGTVIDVYKNGVLIGTTTVTGGVWTLSGVSGLLVNDEITATATAPSKTISPLSNTVIVQPVPLPATTDTAPVTGSYLEGATTITGTLVGGTAVAGDVVNVYIDGVKIAAYILTATDITNSTWSVNDAYSPDDEFDVFALYAGGVISATVTRTGFSEGATSTTQTVQCAPADANKTLNVLSTSVCENSSATIEMLNSDLNIIYELWNEANNAQIAASRLGNGSTITFNTISLTSGVSNINIRAIKFSSVSCTTSAARSITIDTYPNPIDAPLTPTIASPEGIAFGSAATVVINPSENLVEYTLYNKANDAVVGQGIGNGASLNITTTATFTSDVDIYVIARKTHTAPDPDLVCDLTLTTEARFEIVPGPVANPDINNTLIGTAVTGNVLTNDTDLNGGNLIVNTTPTVAPANGTLLLNANGTYTYQPNVGFVGTDSFTYEVCNDATTPICTQATVSINVYQVSENLATNNNPPVVHDDKGETIEGIVARGNVLSNDFDPDAGQTLTVTVATNVAITGGTYSIDAAGNYTFTPSPGFTGTTSFDYTVCDNGSPQACETATVSITVYPDESPANYAPFAQDDVAFVEQGGTLNGTSVLLNDFDPDGAFPMTGTVTLVTNVSHGALTLNANGTYTYTPSAGYYGADSFVYRVCDGGTPNECDEATVYIMVQPRTPSPQPDINNTLMNTPVAGNVLTNDQDPQGLALTVTTTTVSNASGTVVFNTDGTYTFTPAFNFEGAATFTYEVCNTLSVCQTATLNIQVQKQLPQFPVAQNNAPVANNDVGQTLAGVTLAGNVLVNDFDRDADAISVTAGSTPQTNAAGTLTINDLNTGTYTFVPTASFVGNTSFDYTITDGTASSTATVNITVYPDQDALNNPPFAQDDAGFIFQNTAAVPTFLPGNVLVNDFDPEGTNPMTGTVSLVSDVSNGVLALNANGTYTYTPTIGYTGPDQFTYQVCDAGTPALCDVATVYLTVQAASPLPPLARNDLANTLLNTDVSGTTGFNDLDLLGLRTVVATPALTVSPANGTVVFNADGTYTYTPDNAFTGQDEFTYQICNSAGLCDVATVKINVIEPVASGNTPPTVQDDYAETIQGNTVNGNLLSNDFDYDGDNLVITQIVIGLVTYPIASGGNSGSIVFAGGTLVVNSDGTFTLTSPGTADQFTFDYTVCDDGSPVECRTATSTITVYPTGSPNLPFTQNDALATANGNAVVSNVINNDSNLGTVLSLTVVTPPSNGTLVGPDINGAFTYTPDAGYEGPDYFVYEVCNTNGCSQAMVSLTSFDAASPLPISLLRFTASLLTDDKVQLDWTTAAEQDNALFEIYRSADAQTWEMVGSKEGAGNSLTRLDYSLIDTSPLAGLNYYRLKQIDFDGTFTYSQAIAINVAKIQWNVYPNPTARFVNVDLGEIEGKVSLQLFDSKGNLLKTVDWEARPHEIIQLDIEELSIAAYYLQINAGDNVLKRVLIKH